MPLCYVCAQPARAIATDQCAADHPTRRGTLERIPFALNGLRSISFAAAHVLFGKPVSTFPEHALAALLGVGLKLGLEGGELGNG